MKDFKKENIFVTGGCGFVGRHLVKTLLEDGYNIWILDNLFTGEHPDKWLKGFEKKSEIFGATYDKQDQTITFINEDAIDFFRNQLKGDCIIDLPNFKEVYHLAAVVGGRAVLIEENPMLVATNHIIDSLFFQWAVSKKESIGAILYISTSVSYPKAMQDRDKHVAMKEEYLDLTKHTNIGMPESIYGWVKMAGEYLGVVASQRYNMSVVSVRPFSGYGDDQSLSYPLPSIAARVAKREDPLIVWGSGDQGRDFIYIDDFVSALRIAIKNINDGSSVNIGMGQLTTFKQVARMMADIEGYNPKVQPKIEKAEGSFAVYGDISRLKSFGWKPKYTIEEGFTKVLANVKERSEVKSKITKKDRTLI